MHRSGLPVLFPALLLVFVLLGGCDHDRDGIVDGNAPPLESDLPEVVGMSFWSPRGDAAYDEYAQPGDALFLRAGDVRDSLQVRFTGRNGYEIPDSVLGGHATLRLETTPEGILAASLYPGRPFCIRLEAAEYGEAHLSVRLVHGDSIAYTSYGVETKVVRPDPGWWDGFGEDNAPNGRVHDMAVYRGALIITGEFTRIGARVASEGIHGVAGWNGTEWSAMGRGLDGAKWLLTEGDLLVAGGPDLGFYRWDGADWVRIADPPQENATAAALFQGEVFVTGSGMGVVAWRDASWQTVATARMMSGHALDSHQGALYVGASTYLGATQIEETFVARVEGDALIRVLELYSNDMVSSSVDHLKSHGTDLLVAWSSASPVGQGDKIVWIEGVLNRQVDKNTGVRPRGSALAGGKLYVVDRQSVLVDEAIGLRPIAEAENGEIQDAEAFQGALYVSGSFTAIDGTPSFRIAKLAP